jgi:hypothetical protein
MAVVKTIREVLTEYRLHPEAKSLGPDRQPCEPTTIGLLRRRPVKVPSVTRDGETISAITYIGKESNNLAEVASGLITNLDDALNEYQDPDRSPLWELARAAIQREPVQSVAAGAGVSISTVKRARAGTLIGETARSGDARARLIAWAVKHARAELRGLGARAHDATAETVLASYLEAEGPRPTETPALCACGCGRPVPTAKRLGRPRKYIDETHRKRAQRAVSSGQRPRRR